MTIPIPPPLTSIALAQYCFFITMNRTLRKISEAHVGYLDWLGAGAQADGTNESWVLSGESHGGLMVSNVDKGWWNSRAWDVYITGTPLQFACINGPVTHRFACSSADVSVDQTLAAAAAASWVIPGQQLQRG